MHTALRGRARSATGVMLSPFAVILSEAKDLCSSLRVNSAKHPRSLWLVLSAKTTAVPLQRDRPPESTAGSG
jgi:hypothetical protein